MWDAQTCCELATLGPFHRQGVAALAWAPDGRGLASVGGDVEHSLALWESAGGGWDDARRTAYAPGDHQAMTPRRPSRHAPSPHTQAPAQSQHTPLSPGAGAAEPPRQAVLFAAFLDPADWGAGMACAPPVKAGFDGPPHPGYQLATGEHLHPLLPTFPPPPPCAAQPFTTTVAPIVCLSPTPFPCARWGGPREVLERGGAHNDGGAGTVGTRRQGKDATS